MLNCNVFYFSFSFTLNLFNNTFFIQYFVYFLIFFLCTDDVSGIALNVFLSFSISVTIWMWSSSTNSSWLCVCLKLNVFSTVAGPWSVLNTVGLRAYMLFQDVT